MAYAGKMFDKTVSLVRILSTADNADTAYVSEVDVIYTDKIRGVIKLSILSRE